MTEFIDRDRRMTAMVKTYVLDTNVLIQSPYSFECFEDNDVVITVTVLEEFDAMKRAEGEKGRNARSAIRYLENMRSHGDLLQGIPLKGGGMLKVVVEREDVEIPTSLSHSKSDNRILMTCKTVIADDDKKVILVTKDMMVRIKAQVMGIPAEDFITEQVSFGDEQYTGRIEVYAAEHLFDEFKRIGIGVDEVYTCDEEGNKYTPTLVENQFVTLRADQSINKTILGRVEGDRIVRLEYAKESPYGVRPRNSGQYFLQEALMQPADEAPLVIVKGMAGTAKTFYSIAVGLEKVLNRPTGEYRRVLICRPNAQFDSDIGYLPGSEKDKISPLMRPVVDNLEQLIDSNDDERYKNERELKDKIDEIFERGIIQAEAMNYLRGRSLAQTYLIIDEAQNMTPNQVKGIITRAGKGTKVILLGDPNQIDRPFLDERTNGLSYACEYMKGSPLCYQITMSADECERSALAMDAVKRLSKKVLV